MSQSTGANVGETDFLETLYETERLAGLPLSDALRTWYGGPLNLPERGLYANFVTSLDGVAVVGDSSGSQLSQHSRADRMVMGLLRACADAVLIGTGTLRGSPGHRWTPEHVFPSGRQEFAELRRRLKLPSRPVLALASGSGKIDWGHPGLEAGGLILTSDEGVRRIPGRPDLEVVSVAGVGPLPARRILECLSQRGYRRILSEGGPRLLGSLLAAEAVDDLFLSLSPLLAGRTDRQPRAGFLAGVDLLGRSQDIRLLSVRHHRSLLFLHYRLGGGAPVPDLASQVSPGGRI